MENESKLHRLIAALKTLIRFGSRHAACLQAMEKDYIHHWKDKGSGDPLSIRLRIRPCGDLYEVTRDYLSNDQFKVTEKWLATYGWHSKGHLIALGRTTYVVFDPARKLVFVENIPLDGKETLEIYHEA
jgi:hypothetical protein